MELSSCLVQPSSLALTVQKAQPTFAFAPGSSFYPSILAAQPAYAFDFEAIDIPQLLYRGGAFSSSQLAQQLAEDIRGFRPQAL
eukprot:3082144-Amphidinium_carterae.1